MERGKASAQDAHPRVRSQPRERAGRAFGALGAYISAMVDPALQPRTVLLGCSFAGLEFLYRLARRRGRFAPGEMTVVEPRDLHPYIPLTHEAALGARPPAALEFDTPAFCRALGAEWMAGSAAALDEARRVVILADGREVPYERLIVAVGSVPDVPEPFARSPAVIAVKFLDAAIALHRRLHVLRVSGAQSVRVVVVGAGITGVEWSAELAGGRVDGTRVATTLIGAHARILPRFHHRVARRVAHHLSELHIEVLTGRRALRLTADHILLEGGTAIPFDVVVWAGGVRPAPVAAALGLPCTARGHVVVSPRLAVPGHEGVYAIGDCARIVEGEREWPTMERAIEAIWQGAYLARRAAAGWPPDAGPPHRLRRDFFYGLSLGPRRSAIVYRGTIAEGRTLVWFRRWLEWAYYARFGWLARSLGRARRSS